MEDTKCARLGVAKAGPENAGGGIAPHVLRLLPADSRLCPRNFHTSDTSAL